MVVVDEEGEEETVGGGASSEVTMGAREGRGARLGDAVLERLLLEADRGEEMVAGTAGTGGIVEAADLAGAETVLDLASSTAR